MVATDAKRIAADGTAAATCELTERRCMGQRVARSGGCVVIRPCPTLAAMDNDRMTTQYEIRVRGQLSDRLLSAFPEMYARMLDGETVLRGPLPDQSALHGVLARIEALGLELLEVRRARARGRPHLQATASRPRPEPTPDLP
jgi:hypothetical protein